MQHSRPKIRLLIITRWVIWTARRFIFIIVFGKYKEVEFLVSNDFIKRAMVHKTDKTLFQFLRYGFVALAAFGVDFGLYVLLNSLLNVHPVLSATLSFCLGIVVNYILSVAWVFSNRTRSARAEFVAFAIIGLVGLMLTDLIIYVLAIKAEYDPTMSKLIATAIVFFWNFGARKVMLFKSPGNQKQASDTGE